MTLDKEELQKLEDNPLSPAGKRAEKQRFMEQEMGIRVKNFQEALKNPTKRLSSDPDVKHDAHLVDTQGFQTTVRITVDDDIENRKEVIEKHPNIPNNRRQELGGES